MVAECPSLAGLGLLSTTLPVGSGVSPRHPGKGWRGYCFPYILHTMTPREWSRLSDETDSAYAAFQEWLHSSDGNGLRQDVYEWAGRWEDDGRKAEILRWAASDFWVLRAKAYDAWVGKRQVIKNFPLCAPAGVLMVKIATTELEKISAMQDRAGDMPGVLDARLIDRWFARVLKMEEASKKWDAVQAASLTPGQALYDFTKLEIDEIRVLEALHEKAKV